MHDAFAPLAYATLGALAVVGTVSVLGDGPDPEPSVQVELANAPTVDGSDQTVDTLVGTVREAARLVDGADPDVDLHVVLADDLGPLLDDGRALLAGQQRGDTIFVRTSVAWPERTLLHEAAHAMTPGDGHGPRWQAVYLEAFRQTFGPEDAEHEARRIEHNYG